MRLRNVLAHDRAVSPVIGVILMVGITVVLASVIGVFILGVDATSSAPDAEFRYVADQGSIDGWGDSTDTERFLVQHDGGEDVDLDHVTIRYDGTDVSTISGLNSFPPSDPYWRPGDTWEVTDPSPDSGTDFGTDKEVLVIWTTANGGSSQILERGDLP